MIRVSDQTKKLGWVRRAFPLRGRIHVTVFYPLKSTMYSFKIFREESTDLRYLFLDRYTLAGVCFPGSDSVELFWSHGQYWSSHAWHPMSLLGDEEGSVTEKDSQTYSSAPSLNRARSFLLPLPMTRMSSQWCLFWKYHVSPLCHSFRYSSLPRRGARYRPIQDYNHVITIFEKTLAPMYKPFGLD